MRRKTPENVLLPADLPEVESFRVDLLDASEFAGVDQFFEFENGGMIPK
jgi:hypothetical protein